MKKDYIQTAAHVFIMLMILTFLILMSAGFRFEISRLGEIEFWGDVFARCFLALVVFNLAYGDFFKAKKKDKNSRYYYAVATKQLKTKVIYNKHLFAELDEAIKAENTERYIAECDNLLHKVSKRVNYRDLPLDANGVYNGEKSIDEWFHEALRTFSVDEKLEKKLRKVVMKIINGRVFVKPITADDILIETEDSYDVLRPMVFSEKRAQTLSTIKKSVIYICSCVGLVVISYEPTWFDFLFNLISNLMLSCGAVVSGMTEADRNVKLKTAVFERHNSMLANRLGIRDEYTPKTENSGAQ